MHRLLSVSVIALSVLFFSACKRPSRTFSLPGPDKNPATEIKNDEAERLHGYALKARAFVQENGFCERYYFFADMRIASGKKRFFVYDLQHDSVIIAGLVTHGSGSVTETAALKFSNTEGSNATSVGKYKIGAEYNGDFGLAFKLYGLDATNSNAFKRFVVLHSHRLVPTEEVYPDGICTSWGCPTVNPDFLQRLKKYINGADKPVLLWIVS